MMKEIKNFNEQERQKYVPASVKVIETSVQRVICASNNEGYNDGNKTGGESVFCRANQWYYWL